MKVKFEISNFLLIALILVWTLLMTGVVLAYTGTLTVPFSSNKANTQGHSIDEINWSQLEDCDAGSSIKRIYNDGSVDCEDDDVASGSGSPGLGVYTGTASASNGDLGGYEGANSRCGVGKRMCSGSDFVNGLPSTSGWYSSSVIFLGVSGNHNPIDDCQSWKSTSTGRYGRWWDSANNRPGIRACNTAQPILCCQDV